MKYLNKNKNLSNFLVIILAAGLGRRLGANGKLKPKSLTTINKKTILKRIIEKLSNFKAEKIHFILGYKHKQILNYLKKNNINFSYSYSKKYRSTSTGYSWLLAEKIFLKFKKPSILLHADILFSDQYLKNIIDSKINNIIGSKKILKNKKLKDVYKIFTDNNLSINRISKMQSNHIPYSEVIGINKFSFQFQKHIYNFLKLKLKDENNKNLTWEELINIYVNENKKKKIYVLKNQKYKWININRKKDIIHARKLKFK